MNLGDICENIFKPLDSVIAGTGAGYIEAVLRSKNALTSFYKHSFINDFPHLSYEVLDKKNGFESIENFTHTEEISKFQKKIHCFIYPLKSSGVVSGYLIIESGQQLTDESLALIKSISGVLAAFQSSETGSTAEKPGVKKEHRDEKYHNELMNIRDIQAKLFPEFDNIDEMDIRSAYLPAEIMSGTFIDGFFADKTTYILAACDVSDYGPASLFVGAAIRTIIRTVEFQKMIPSMMITAIETRIKNLAAGGNISDIHLTIYQLNLKTGKAVISSYGPITTLFYTSKKSGLIDLGNTEAGKLFAKRTFFRDLTITLETGDTLLYYTRGVIKAKRDFDEQEYGLPRLKENTRANISGESLELVHALTESVYEFTDYNPVREDIILISMKML